ncbi:hypothetical protein PV327_009059 [Microctonus hyperodae]|uniref:Uncharacterized protein n=1 Tax=Microctonus hyperodae TaxID=165561 RepID=A0AA39KVI1_MICHY|nr:hypothetical protein PV327_009059 [Microctonus hyperodae]
MIPSKPEKSSRRSSILKLPKPRQPFQTVESNGLSAEESPMKLKRRVSFAEKKHVKEFCDSMEQGTVWDNTYEESELSFPKTNIPPNTDNNSYIQVLSERSDALNYQSLPQESEDNNLNLFDSNNLNNHQSKKILQRQNAVDLDYLPIEAICSRLEPGDISRVIVSANPELLANKENIPAVLAIPRIESSLIEDEELSVSQKFVQNFNSQSFSVYCDDNMEDEDEDCSVLNNTNHQNISMDCTLPATESILSSHNNSTIGEKEIINPDKETEKTQIFDDNVMEMTQVVTSNLCSKSKEIQNRRSILHDKSMEITEAVLPSYSAVQQLNIRANDSMEITQAAVPSSIIFINQQQIGNDKTQLFNNKSMEITEAVSSIHPGQYHENKTQIFHNKSMELTLPMSSKPPNQFSEDRTQLFNNKSMEITESVSPKLPQQLFENRTQVFNDKSMEITEAVSGLGQFPGNKTQIFHNKSMEMTQAMSSIRPKRYSESKTQVFHDNPMEMTEIVASSKRQMKCFEDRTQVFNNKSMEITEALPSIRSGRFPEDITQVFHNKSMEMTEAVPSIIPQQFLPTNQRTLNNNPKEVMNKKARMASPLVLKHPEHLPEDHTQFFCNKSMEMTEVVCQQKSPSATIQQNDCEQFESITDTSNHLQYSHNYCMEHTENIPSLKRQYQQISNENEKFDGVLSSPNAKNRCSNSIVQKRQISEKDVEALHRLLHQNLDESGEKSILESQNPVNNHNESMEMTAAVPAHFTTSQYLNQQNLSLQNLSMEMTQAIPSLINNKNQTIASREDELIAPIENISAIQVIPSNTASKDNLDNSIEELRFRASLISNCYNDEATYNFTAPICSRVSSGNISNEIENVEVPSFVYADISDEVPAFEIQQQMDEESVPIPHVSITEDFSHLKNRRLTHVINRKEPMTNEEAHEEINESVNDEMNTNFGVLPVGFDNNIQIINNIVNKNTTVSVETDLEQNKILTEESNQNTGRRKTYVVNNDEKSAMFQRRKITRSSTYVINPGRINVNDEINVEDDELQNSSELQRCLSPSQLIDKSTLPLNTLEKSIVSPVKKINFEFVSVAENDLIFAQIKKQRIAIEKKRAKMEVENQLKDKSNGELMESITKNYTMNRFDVLTDQLNEIANKRDCIWKVYSITPKVISIEYCMIALVMEIVFNVPEHPNELEIIERVKMIPRISDEENAILRMTDRLIVQKIDVENLRKNYKTYDDILQLIECVTNEVNKIYDFYHELKRLSCLNLMEIFLDKISFNVWTKQMNIILKISMNIKSFAEIQPEDIDVQCLLGNVRTNDVKDLIKNTKRNYNFLTLYINDIKDYIELMEISTSSRK